MSVLRDCWQNIIGITRTTNTCLDSSEISPDYDYSNSGLYIDELKGINLQFVEDTGDTPDMWTKIERARENAIRTVQMDALGEILKTNKPRYELFKGNIGSQKYNANINLLTTYAGLRFFANDIRGGIFYLTGINTVFNTTGTFDINIYNNLSTDILHTITVNSIANRMESNILASPITLPLWDDNYENIEYYFIYTASGNTPKNNNATCGCGGVNWCYNRKNPCFADKAVKDRWRQFAMVGGITGNDLTTLEDWPTTQAMNGLILVGQYKCDPTIYLCNDSIDYESDQFGIAVAYAVLYKTGEYVMDEFLNTSEVSRYTLMGQEAMVNNREFYNARYTAMIDFIKANIDINQFGCLTCKPAMGMSKGFQKL